MKLWRVIMSVHTQDNGWSASHPLPTFYVHGIDVAVAKQQALAVAATLKPNRGTSGSLASVDSSLDVILTDEPGMHPAEYHTWSEL